MTSLDTNDYVIVFSHSKCVRGELWDWNETNSSFSFPCYLTSLLCAFSSTSSYSDASSSQHCLSSFLSYHVTSSVVRSARLRLSRRLDWRDEASNWSFTSIAVRWRYQLHFLAFIGHVIISWRHRRNFVTFFISCPKVAIGAHELVTSQLFMQINRHYYSFYVHRIEKWWRYRLFDELRHQVLACCLKSLCI